MQRAYSFGRTVTGDEDQSGAIMRGSAARHTNHIDIQKHTISLTSPSPSPSHSHSHSHSHSRPDRHHPET